MDVGLFRHHVTLQNPVEEVLRGLGMPHEHAGIEEVRDFQRVRLNRQRRIDAAARHDHLDGQPRAGPHREVFHSAHRAGACRRGEHARAAERGSGALRHDGELALTSEIVADIAFGKQLADQGGGFALRRDRVGDHHVAARAADRFLNDFAAGKERRRARRLMEHLPRVRIRLSFFILCPNEGFHFRHGSSLLSRHHGCPNGQFELPFLAVVSRGWTVPFSFLTQSASVMIFSTDASRKDSMASSWPACAHIAMV